MDLETIVKALNLKVRSGNDKLKNEVQGGYAGDLLSDVMGNSKEGNLWVTRQIHQNIVAVASLKDHAGILLVQGAEPAPDTIEKDMNEGIPIMVTDLPSFEVIGKIYSLLNKEI